jgi:hypothetical protein
MFLDRGLKKADFFKVDSPNMNDYYNKMKSQQNSVVDGIIKEQFKYEPSDRPKAKMPLEEPYQKEIERRNMRLADQNQVYQMDPYSSGSYHHSMPSAHYNNILKNQIHFKQEMIGQPAPRGKDMDEYPLHLNKRGTRVMPMEQKNVSSMDCERQYGSHSSIDGKLKQIHD